MDLFWEPLFRSLQSNNPLCEAAAGHCLTSLGGLVGPRILEGHLTEDQHAVLAARGLIAGLHDCSGARTVYALQRPHVHVAYMLSLSSLCRYSVDILFTANAAARCCRCGPRSSCGCLCSLGGIATAVRACASHVLHCLCSLPGGLYPICVWASHREDLIAAKALITAPYSSSQQFTLNVSNCTSIQVALLL